MARVSISPEPDASCAHCAPQGTAQARAYLVRCACGHEHAVRACDIYAPVLTAFWCTPCFDAGHDCPMGPPPAVQFANGQ